MSTVGGFMSQFDDKGAFRAGAGEVKVVFSTPTGKPYPGSRNPLGFDRAWWQTTGITSPRPFSRESSPCHA